MPDAITAATYGKISFQLDVKGQRIPENDTWIAAVALEGRTKLATGDAHFNRIEELEVILLDW